MCIMAFDFSDAFNSIYKKKFNLLYNRIVDEQIKDQENEDNLFMKKLNEITMMYGWKFFDKEIMQMGNKGTPQGAKSSPFKYNIIMRQLISSFERQKYWLT